MLSLDSRNVGEFSAITYPITSLANLPILFGDLYVLPKQAQAPSPIPIAAYVEGDENGKRESLVGRMQQGAAVPMFLTQDSPQLRRRRSTGSTDNFT